MQHNAIGIAVLALLVGAGAGYLFNDAARPTPGTHEMENGSMMSNDGMDMSGAMDDMMAGLEGKTGDEFDKAFLSEMITHHQGAVDMAKAALANAKHEEIKTMANAILSAQTAEIQQMQEWQKSWYGQ